MDRTPDVRASTAPVLVTVPNVPLVEAGVEYQLSTGPTTFSPEDLRDLVTAANEDFAIPAARIKIGHVDPRFNNQDPYDGTPAFGSWRNLRLGENGMVVYADAVGVPKWLADVMPSAYPSRSIEGYWNVESQSGKTWRFVMSACSILGVTWPGITVLEDLPQWYGDTIPEGAVIDEELVAARAGGDPTKPKTAAAANLDDIRREFYAAHQDDWWWIRAVMTDPNQVVAEDDQDGQLYLIDFSSDASGNVSFSEPQPVRVQYVPDDREAQKAAAAFVAAGIMAVNNDRIAVSYASVDDSRPPKDTTQEGGSLDPKQLRKQLGLAEDASEDQVQARLASLVAASSGDAGNGEGDEGAPDEGDTGTGEGTGDEGVTPPAVQQPAPAAVASGNGMVTMDPAEYERLRTAASRADELWQGQQLTRRHEVVNQAVASGKFPPARRDHWLKALEVDFEGSKAAIDSLAPGLVPVSEIGSSPDHTNENMSTGYPAFLFPEVVRRKGQQEAIASGSMDRPRITREEGF